MPTSLQGYQSQREVSKSPVVSGRSTSRLVLTDWNRVQLMPQASPPSGTVWNLGSETGMGAEKVKLIILASHKALRPYPIGYASQNLPRILNGHHLQSFLTPIANHIQSHIHPTQLTAAIPRTHLIASYDKYKRCAAESRSTLHVSEP